MKKKMYRIELKSMEWHIAKDVSVLAAFSNGSETKLSLNELANHVKLHNSAVGGQPFTVSVIEKVTGKSAGDPDAVAVLLTVLN